MEYCPKCAEKMTVTAADEDGWEPMWLCPACGETVNYDYAEEGSLADDAFLEERLIEEGDTE